MEAETAYLFRHALLRDAAYQLQLPGDRARLHALALEIMESAFGRDGVAADAMAAELAEHARLAAETPESAARRDMLAREHEYLLRAASHARASANYAGLVELLRRAGEYEGLTAPRRAELRVELATALNQAGRVAQSVTESRALLEDARAQGSKVLAGRAMHVLGLALGDAGQAAEGREMLTQAAEHLLEARDYARAGTCLAALGSQLMNAGEGVKSRDVFERALALAREHALSVVERAVYPGLAVLLHRLGQSHEAERMLRQSLEIAAKLGATDISRELAHLYLVYQATGRNAEARDCINRSIEANRRSGNQRGEAIALGNLANMEGLAGNLDLADELYRRASAIHLETGNLRAQASLLARIATVEAARGNGERAIEMTIHAIRAARKTQAADFLKLALANLGTYAVDFGLLPASVRCYREAIEIARAAQDTTFAMCTSAQLACVLILLGDFPQARTLAEKSNELIGVAQSAVWRLSDVLPARVRTLCAGWIDAHTCHLVRSDIELARQAVDEMHALGRQTGSAAAQVEIDRMARYERLLEESTGALAEARKPLIFRGYFATELDEHARATILDLLREREPATLKAMALQHPRLLAALESGTLGIKPGNWRKEDLISD